MRAISRRRNYVLAVAAFGASLMWGGFLVAKGYAFAEMLGWLAVVAAVFAAFLAGVAISAWVFHAIPGSIHWSGPVVVFLDIALPAIIGLTLLYLCVRPMIAALAP